MAFVKKQAQPEAIQPEPTEELKRKIEKLKKDFPTYARLNLKLKDKDGGIVPFDLNVPQQFLHAQVEAQLKETGRVRIIGLKGRQQGFSTYVEGRYYWRTSLNSGKSAYILTHEIPATDHLFKMAKRYHDNSHPGLKPHTGASNVKELIFDKLDSGYKVGTAGGQEGVGRSGTHQYFHGSEVASWKNAYEHFSGVLECVSEGPGTEIILESTALGASGKFYELWIAAINKKTDYRAVFVPWYWSPEYRKDTTEFEPTAEELEKQRIYGVDLAQLCWRRSKINSMGKSMADQEYPYCWQDAFLASGRTRFETDEMASALKECWSPRKRMMLEKGKFVDREEGPLRLWEEPKAGLRYSIGGDVALGKEGGDYSCADIVEVRTGMQVAQWHGHIAPDLFAEVLYALGKWYNNALLVCESNNYGHTTNITLRDMNYPNIYVQTLLSDKGSGENETRNLGFNTNRNSKRYITDELAALFRNGETGLCCKETVQECQTYIILEDESLAAAPKCFDDRVISYALAQYGAAQSPAHKRGKK